MLTMTQKTKADTVVKKKKGPIMEKLVLLITAVVVLGQGTTQARATDHETYTPQQIKEMPRFSGIENRRCPKARYPSVKRRLECKKRVRVEIYEKSKAT